MTWLAILIALASLGVSVGAVRRSKALVRALEAEKRENNELVTTLVEVLDEEGNIRGELALPGQVASRGVSNRLALAEKSVSTIQEEIRDFTQVLREDVKQASADLRQAKGELEAGQSREARLQKTLAEVVDGDGQVLAQLRLPGKKVKAPDRTPCGDMCKHAFWHDSSGFSNGKWHCRAGQGRPCDDARPRFVDADGQCVLFVRDTDC